MLSKFKAERIDTSFSEFIRTAKSGDKKRIYRSVIKGAVKEQSRVIDATFGDNRDTNCT